MNQDTLDVAVPIAKPAKHLPIIFAKDVKLDSTPAKEILAKLNVK